MKKHLLAITIPLVVAGCFFNSSNSSNRDDISFSSKESKKDALDRNGLLAPKLNSIENPESPEDHIQTVDEILKLDKNQDNKSIIPENETTLPSGMVKPQNEQKNIQQPITPKDIDFFAPPDEVTTDKPKETTRNTKTSQPTIEIESPAEESFTLPLPISPKTTALQNMDGYEANPNWLCANWGDPAKIEISYSKQPNVGKVIRIKGLDIENNQPAKGKIAVELIGFTPIVTKDYKSISISTSYTGKGTPTLALSLSTGNEYEYFESETRPFADGQLLMTFDLTDKRWKSAKSKWEPKTSVTGDSIRKIALIIYNIPKNDLVVINKIAVNPDNSP